MSTDFGFAATSKSPYYFVSYNTEDAERVAEICRRLSEKGLPIWYDEGISHDSHWESVLVERIAKCKEVIFFITKGIFEKGWDRSPDEIFTYIEYDYAREYQKSTLIVMLDEIKNAKDEIPHSLMPWWRQIKPSNKQGLVAYGMTSDEVARKILKELSWESNPAYSIHDDIAFPIFNSVMDHPVFGDEREFIHIREHGTQEWQRSIALIAGKQYEVDILFRNDANPEYNSSKYNNQAVALLTTMKVQVPQYVSCTGENIAVTISYLCNTHKGEKARMHECTDLISLIPEEGKSYSIKWVIGQSHIFNKWKTNEQVLSSSLFGYEGTFIGLNVLNGVIPAGDDYAGHVRFFIDVDELAPSVSSVAIIQEASIDGETWHTESIEAKEGDIITFKTTIQNMSSTAITSFLYSEKMLSGISMLDNISVHTQRFPEGFLINKEQFLSKGIEINIGGHNIITIISQKLIGTSTREAPLTIESNLFSTFDEFKISSIYSIFVRD